MTLRPLDSDILRRFSSTLLTAGKMMDRLDVRDGFRYEERTRLFHVQLRYWRGVLEHFEPDVVLFPVQPHTVYDYILYELCQAYGVRTSMFQWTVFHDWLYPLDHIDRGYVEIQDRYRNWLATGAEDVDLAPAVEQYLQTVSGDYRRAIPDYLVEQMPPALHAAIFAEGDAVGDFGLVSEQIARDASSAAKPAVPVNLPAARLWSTDRRRAWKYFMRYVEHHARSGRRALRHARMATARRVRRTMAPAAIGRSVGRLILLPKRSFKSARLFYRRQLKMAVRGALAGGLNRPLKEPTRSMEQSFRGRLGGARLHQLRRAGGRKKRELLREYLQRCGDLDFKGPFIFVALHYQPEQTTSPTGSVFVDQAVMIDMLARSVPADWLIYVKEHPFQFFPSSLGERSRSVEFYDDLLAHPNVRLVPWSVSPFELIDHAQAVATVTGTTGIEAALRGRPVLAFGYAWYRDCEGVFYTPDVASLCAALDQIAGGYRVDRRRVRFYLRAVQDACFRADMDFGVHIDPIPHEENVANVAAGIRRILERPRTSSSPYA
jgi:hypothetical protein